MLVTAPDRRANRLLALGLIAEAVVQGGSIITSTLAEPWSRPFRLLVPFAVGAVPFVYLLILSILDTPLVGWLRRPPVQWSVAALALLLGAVTTFLVMAPSLPGLVIFVMGVYGLIGAMLIFAFIVGVDALRRAHPGSTARGQAFAFLLSFSLRDAFAAVGLLLVVIASLRGGDVIRVRDPLGAVGENIARIGTILAVPLLAYGILRTQIFDIDLRIRWSISRGRSSASSSSSTTSSPSSSSST